MIINMKRIGGNGSTKKRTQRLGLWLLVTLLTVQSIFGIFASNNAYAATANIDEHYNHIKAYILTHAIMEKCKPKGEITYKGEKNSVFNRIASSYEYGGFLDSFMPAVNVSAMVDNLGNGDVGDVWCWEAYKLVFPLLGKTAEKFIEDAYTINPASQPITATARCQFNEWEPNSQQYIAQTYDIYYKKYDSWWSVYHSNGDSKPEKRAETKNDISGANKACKELETATREPLSGANLNYNGNVNSQYVDKLTNFKWPDWFKPDIDNADPYLFYNYMLTTTGEGFCGADIKSKADADNLQTSAKVYLNPYYAPGSIEPHDSAAVMESGTWRKVMMPTYSGLPLGGWQNDKNNSCKDIAEKLNEKASAYFGYMGEAAAEETCSKYTETYAKDACKSGFSNKGDSLWCFETARKDFDNSHLDGVFGRQLGGKTYTPKVDNKKTYGNDLKDAYEKGGRNISPPEIPTIIEACLYGQYTAYVPPPPSSADEPNPENTCESSSGSFGWLMCPLIKLLGDAVSWMMGQVNNRLNYQTLNEKGTGEIMRDVWGAFIPIANIAFAIVFLIIIYSTAVGGKLG